MSPGLERGASRRTWNSRARESKETDVFSRRRARGGVRRDLRRVRNTEYVDLVCLSEFLENRPLGAPRNEIAKITGPEENLVSVSPYSLSDWRFVRRTGSLENASIAKLVEIRTTTWDKIIGPCCVAFRRLSRGVPRGNCSRSAGSFYESKRGNRKNAAGMMTTITSWNLGFNANASEY